jgi:hypothetical protein
MTLQVAAIGIELEQQVGNGPQRRPEVVGQLLSAPVRQPCVR